MKNFLVIIGIGSFLLMSCHSSPKAPQEVGLHSLHEQEDEFPEFLGKDIFLRSSGVQISHFNYREKDWSLKAKNMFGCVGEQYFVEGTDFCFYFDDLWIQSGIPSDKGVKFFALSAEAAYTNKIFNSFLFHDSILTIEGGNFVLSSNVVKWEKNQNALSSPPSSRHIMKDNMGNVLQGRKLFLDYQKHTLTMERAQLDLVEDL